MLQRQIPWVEEEIGYKLNCNNIHSPKVFKDIMRTPNFGKKKYYMLKGYLTGEFATMYPDKVTIRSKYAKSRNSNPIVKK